MKENTNNSGEIIQNNEVNSNIPQLKHPKTN